ncbi:hypothetical protein C8R43DRAFT_1241862 [Mycena crocata]|nr:hypothetical protein C8R43DRAFT_1241862 [Mycena crocata]
MVRSILFTGANQGLGYHAVHQLSATPGVLVFMGSRKLAAAQEAIAKFAADVHPSSSVVPVQLDITDDNSIKAAHSFIADFLKKKEIPALDVLVNNAAILVGSFEEIYKTNVLGTAALTEAILPLLAKGSAILNISSDLGSIASYTPDAGRPLYIPYASSKSALNALTVLWARQQEQNGTGIRVVSICPGLNATAATGYTSAGMSPADGCKVIVKAALEKEGRTGVFFNKDGDLAW